MEPSIVKEKEKGWAEAGSKGGGVDGDNEQVVVGQ
jgi:hypothetical protein